MKGLITLTGSPPLEGGLGPGAPATPLKSGRELRHDELWMRLEIETTSSAHIALTELNSTAKRPERSSPVQFSSV